MHGLVSISSVYPFAETCRRLEAAIHDRGVRLFDKIDHAALAQSAGLTLRPTTAYVFGNPAAGTPLMERMPTLGLDLPLRVLVYAAQSVCYVCYWPLLALVENHHGEIRSIRDAVTQIEALVADLVSEAVGEPLT